jgi:hypothetical protein
MPGLTADDWPYLESGDAPDLPLATEGLALKGQSLEERVAIIETLTADTDFVSMGGSGSPMLFAGGTSASRIVAQSGSPGIRLIGGKLAYLRGSLARFNGDPMTGLVTLGTIAAGMRPTGYVKKTVAVSTAGSAVMGVARLDIQTDGTVNLVTSEAIDWVSLDSIWYFRA